MVEGMDMSYCPTCGRDGGDPCRYCGSSNKKPPQGVIVTDPAATWWDRYGALEQRMHETRKPEEREELRRQLLEMVQNANARAPERL